VYIIWDQDERRAGQIDIHYADLTIHATVILEQRLSQEQEEDLIALIDDDIASSYLPAHERDDLVVTVFSGNELRSYTDAPLPEDQDEELT
jgi:hypothetical protein